VARRRARISIITAAAACVAGLVGTSAPAFASAATPAAKPVLSVGGEVTTPASYTAAQLAQLPQTTATVRLGFFGKVTLTGVSLETLVTDASPAYPALVNTKNSILRVTATVTGYDNREVTFAVGELDPNFGNHPALIALSANGRPIPGGPELVVPGDSSPVRTVLGASKITVGIATASATSTSTAAGTPLTIVSGKHTVTLSAALLARLPKETLKVSFLSGNPAVQQTHTEVGPSLSTVLAVAGIWFPTVNTWVAGVGNDNYVATVTPFEQFAGGRPLQISLNEDGVTLAQPRLIADGDIKGGRYVSGLVDLYVGSGPAS
jgi:hypothetical protein